MRSFRENSDTCRGGGGRGGRRRGDRGQPGVRKRVEPGRASRAGHAVFVQTDNTAGNRVVAYDRAADGTLAPAGSYATGGRGGILAGSVVDHTASQGSLASDPRHGLLYAVNAGSDTISVFAVHGDRLALRQVLGSGGTFPVSVAVHGDLVYVLNALNGGSVQGYRVLGRFLVRIPGSHRALGLDPNATPQFTTTPGQVAFTPDGTQLVVTTKGNGNDIDVFGVGGDGGWSDPPEHWIEARGGRTEAGKLQPTASGAGSASCPPASARWCCSATSRG